MAIYNLSFMDNATNPVDLMVGVGNATGQQFLIGYLLLLSFFLIFMILSLKQDFNQVLIVDSFLTTIMAILLFISGMIPAAAISYPAVLCFISILMNLFIK